MNNNQPGLAALLSFLFNGLGQIYNGQIKKGLIIMFFSSIGMLIVLTGAIILGYCLLSSPLFISGIITGLVILVLGVIIIAILGVYNIYDAYRCAQNLPERPASRLGAGLPLDAQAGKLKE